MTTARAVPPWWLVALLVALAFAFQGTRGIWEPDEGRYSATGINMLESGNYLVPTADGEHPHLTKPPLTYWALAASFAAFGLNEWAARLPSALAFVGTGLLVFGLGRRFTPGRPWLPVLAWALGLGPLIGANIVSTDALLTLFETAAMLAFVEAWSRDGRSRRRWAIAMWIAWGLAFMTKGPPGLLPLPAMMLFLALHDRKRLRGLFPLPGVVAFVLVGFTWFALIVRQDPALLGYFLGYEVYDRVFTATHARNAEWYGAFEVYLPVLVVGALPWWVLALVATGGPRRTWRQLRERVAARAPEWLLLLYWLLVPLAIFFVSQSRLQLYVLPLFVPLALIVARPLARWPWLDRRRLTTIAVLTALAIVAIKGAVAHFPSDRDARAIAAAIEEIIDPQDIDEIAFVDMRGFYGLQLYLDINIETVRSGPRGRALPGPAEDEDLCAELAERENNAYALKESRSIRFASAVRDCAMPAPVRLGVFDADGNRIVLFVVPGGERRG
ncbi:MAG: glycosyltransferase family 39 protein [Steroidobacteraceae bacterium]